MTPSENEEHFLVRVKDQLDQSAAELDPAIQAHLRRARYEALHHQPQGIPWLWPMAGFATACTALVVAMLWWPSPPDLTLNGTAQVVEDVEILIAADQLNLYEDLEFYGWLAEHDRAS